MQSVAAIDAEKLETIEQVSDLLFVVQEAGRRLANETHGDAYSDVKAFIDLLHLARGQLNVIEANAAGAR